MEIVAFLFSFSDCRLNSMAFSELFLLYFFMGLRKLLLLLPACLAEVNSLIAKYFFFFFLPLLGLCIGHHGLSST